MLTEKCRFFLFFGLALLCLRSNAQVSASFIPSDKYGCVPTTVRFLNNSTGSGLSYQWDFGDGQGSILSSPAHIYAKAGTYQISLKVTDATGTSDTHSDTVYIFANPVISISAPAAVCEGEKLDFVNQTLSGGGSIKYWTWDFGNGVSSLLEKPSVIYYSSGKYTVTLVAEDSFGCKSDSSFVDLIEVNPTPSADFGFPVTRRCITPITIDFTNNTQGGSSNSYSWDFGDGGSSAAFSPSHTYTSFGKYTVTLIAENGYACADTSEISGNLEFAPLKIDFETPGDGSCSDEEVILKENVQPKLTTATAFSWKIPGYNLTVGRQVAVKLPVGKHKILLKVNNADCSDTLTKVVEVFDVPKNPMQLSDSILCNVNFNMIYDLDTTGIDSFNWFLDSRQTSKQKKGFFRLEEDGPHYFYLFVRDRKGCENLFVDSVLVNRPVFTIGNDTGGCAPYSFNQSLRFEGYYDALRYSWLFDGQDTNAYTGPAPYKLSYSDTGVYFVQVRYRDEIGCEDSLLRLVGAGLKPDIEAEWEHDTVCNGTPLQLTGLYNGSIRPNHHIWWLGVHNYVSKDPEPAIRVIPGPQTITYLAAHNGCYDTAVYDSAIYYLGPHMRFYMNEDTCFSNKRDIIGTVVAADSFWYEINGDWYTHDTNFTYLFEHDDSITMRAYNDSTGCIDSTTEVLILNDKPVINWTVKTMGCVPMDLHIDRSYFRVDSVRWFFNNTWFNSKFDWIDYTFYKGGVSNFKLIGYAGECLLVLDTNIKATGPRIGISTVQSPGCLPKYYTLNDSFWHEEFTDRYWVVDGDTFPSDTFGTKVMVEAVKDASTNVISIQLFAGEDSCVSMLQVNYKYPGIRFTSSCKDSITACEEVRYTFNISVNPEDSALVSKYGFRYGGVSKVSTKPEFYHYFKADGKSDTVYLFAEDIYGCRTTQIVIFTKPRPAMRPEFTSSNAQSSCPPLLVQFKDQSNSVLGEIKDREWYVNGERFSMQSHPSRIFNVPGYYDIKLVVTDKTGCKDSITKDQHVQIGGNAVSINFGPTVLCLNEPLKLSLDTGKADQLEWDLGDGNVLLGDSVSHQYAEPGIYRITVLVSNEEGCTYPLQSPEMIEVRALPEPDFISRHACRNASVKLVDRSVSELPVIKNEWIVEGTGFQNLDSFTFVTGLEQRITVTLQITDSIGCSDSIKKNVKLYDIKGDFSLDKKSYCLGDEVLLTEIIVSDTAIRRVHWLDTSELIADLSDRSYNAAKSGYLDVKMVAENEAGCLDSITRRSVLKVLDPLAAKADLLKRVSVLPDNQLRVEWKQDTTAFFQSYLLYGPGSPISLTDRNDTSYIYNLDASLNPVCLKLGYNDVCANSNSNLFSEHCSMLANGSPDTMKNCVEWTPYYGWQVEKYFIYRLDQGNYVLLDSVDGSTHRFCDEDLSKCREPRQYLIQASGGGYRSFCDTALVRPVWYNVFGAPEILNVSVDGQRIVMDLDTGSGLIPFNHFEAERTGMLGSVVPFVINNPGNYTDESLATNDQFYTYTVKQVDKCGESGSVSAPARSIWLRIVQDPQTSYPLLTWNKSAVWPNGISYYQVERKADDGGFVHVATLMSIDDTSYLDKLEDLECAAVASYRVLAVSIDGAWTSYSNIVLTTANSTLFVPNAFSLNFDGLNDGFQPRGLYIQTYSLKIYNRWGEQLYETTDCMQGWDGTFEGEPVQESVCFYVLEAMGVDGTVHIRHGTIMVLR